MPPKRVFIVKENGKFATFKHDGDLTDRPIIREVSWSNDRDAATQFYTAHAAQYAVEQLRRPVDQQPEIIEDNYRSQK